MHLTEIIEEHGMDQEILNHCVANQKLHTNLSFWCTALSNLLTLFKNLGERKTRAFPTLE